MPKILSKIRNGAVAIPKKVLSAGSVWQHVYTVAKPLFIAKKIRVKTLAHLVGIVVLLSLCAKVSVYTVHALNYFVSDISGATVSIERDAVMEWLHSWITYAGVHGPYSWIVLFFVLLAFIFPFSAWTNYLQQTLGLVWRAFLSQMYFSVYFFRLVWYWLELDEDVDNPDQRMTDNVRDFCATLVVLFVSIVTVGTQIYVWTPDLWQIDEKLTLIVYGWAILASGFSVLIGNPLVLLNNLFNASESNLRFVLQSARREAENMAFLNAPDLAGSQASSRLSDLVAVQKSIFKRNFFLQLFTTPANGLVPALAPMLIAPLLLVGKVELGTLLEAQVAVASLYGALASIIINQLPLLTAFLALAKRLGTLKKAMKKYETQPVPEGGIKMADGDDIVFEQVQLKTKSGNKNLIMGPPLSMVLRKGESLCVLGKNRPAKGELVRLLDRLTASGAGRMHLPKREDVLVLRETPYLPPMTLRQAVTHPCQTCGENDERILKTLRLVGLADLASRCGGLDAVQDWRKLLNLDELQRLNFTRAVMQEHAYVVLEEALSALDPETQARLYALLIRPNRTIISLLLERHLLQYHDVALVLPGKGDWLLCKASECPTDYDQEDEEEEKKKPT